MFAFATLLALASAALPTVLAHGGVLSYANAGKWYEGWFVDHIFLSYFYLTLLSLGHPMTHPLVRPPSSAPGPPSEYPLNLQLIISSNYRHRTATPFRMPLIPPLLATMTVLPVPSSSREPLLLALPSLHTGTRSGPTTLARW